MGVEQWDVPVVDAVASVVGPQALADLIAVDATDRNWRNRTCLLNPARQPLGGQLAAHALMAGCAGGTGEPGSLQFLFVEGANPAQHYTVSVETLRDGRRLAHRALRLSQNGRVLGTGALTLRSIDDPDRRSANVHQPTMPSAPAPDDLPTRAALLDAVADDISPLGRMMLQTYPFLDIRDVNVGVSHKALFWLKIPGSATLDAAQHYGLLTLASDFWYSLPIHSVFPDRDEATRSLLSLSLDHAIWFHTRPDCAQWMLWEVDAIMHDDRYGMVRAHVWQADGTFLATIAQQVMLRAMVAM